MKYTRYLALIILLVNGPLLSYQPIVIRKKEQFVLTNWHRRPIYYALRVEDNVPMLFKRVDAKRQSMRHALNIAQDTRLFIAFDRKPEHNDHVDCYTFKANSYDFLEIKITQDAARRNPRTRIANDEREIERDDYVIHIRSKDNPTVNIEQMVRDDDIRVEKITYTISVDDIEEQRKNVLECMSIEQLEEEVTRVATMLTVIEARGVCDAGERTYFENERRYIRQLLAQRYAQ